MIVLSRCMPANFFRGLMKETDGVALLGGVGEKTEKLLQKLGIGTIHDVLYFLPRSYKDLTNLKKINEMKIEETALLCVTIDSEIKTAHIRKGLEITTFQVADETGRVKINIFNQYYIKQYLSRGQTVYLYGKLEFKRNIPEMASPEIFFKKPEHPYLPNYPLTAGLKQNTLRKIIMGALKGIKTKEFYSAQFIEKFELMGLQDAVAQIHYPKDLDSARHARTRLVFDELLVFSRMIELLNEEKQQESTVRLKKTDTNAFLECFSFAPTNAQRRVMKEIRDDLMGERFMNRMVQGDVGSGKTLVAFYAMHLMHQNGYSSVMMAPTEILAAQHYKNAQDVFPEDDIIYLSGSQTAKQRKKQLDKMEDLQPKVIIGTHALIFEKLHSDKIGLIVTDEQHRFGVRQRAQLASGAHDVHTLIMSATPIPRSLALVLYGKTKISVVDEMPPGRKPVKTYLIHRDKYDTMIGFIKGEADAGRQAYIVCPLIEESEAMDAKSATELFEELQQEFGGYSMELLHGRMKNKEKQRVMDSFAQGETSILVSTTVIEVGVDVANATVMSVVNAERFGLAQLHQLRGRVGRGAQQAYCFLVSDLKSAYERLRILVNTADGFEIAEQDMRLRGAGDVFGTRQHGAGSLKIAGLIEDARQLEKAGKVLDVMSESDEFAPEYAAVTKRAEEAMRGKMVEIAFN